MLFYEKNYWRLNTENLTTKKIIGKEKYRLINKGIEENKIRNNLIEIDNHEDDCINDFMRLYIPFIEKKKNPKIIDIKGNIKKGINEGKKYKLLKITINNEILGMGIFVLKDNKIRILGYRTYNSDIKINKVSIGYYIEYFYIKIGLENGFSIFSRGKDRNGYGHIGSNIGLALHKLELKFLPYIYGNTIEIDKKEIKEESLFFSDPNNEGKQTKAVIYTNKTDEEINKKFGIIEKRGINLIINNLPKR